jgi:hypothetical protein
LRGKHPINTGKVCPELCIIICDIVEKKEVAYGKPNNYIIERTYSES